MLCIGVLLGDALDVNTNLVVIVSAAISVVFAACLTIVAVFIMKTKHNSAQRMPMLLILPAKLKTRNEHMIVVLVFETETLHTFIEY